MKLLHWGRSVKKFIFIFISLSLPEQHSWFSLHPATVGCTEFGGFPICRSLGLNIQQYMSKLLLRELLYVYISVLSSQIFLSYSDGVFSDVTFPIKILSPSVLILPAKPHFLWLYTHL